MAISKIGLGCAALVLLLSAPACSADSSDASGRTPSIDGSPSSVFDSVTVQPASAELSVALGATASQSYKAFGSISGKKIELGNADCSWSVDPAFGTMKAGTLTALPHGGTTTITAKCKGGIGSSALTIDLKGKQVAPGTPANARDLFDAAAAGSDAARTPALEYPTDHAVMPRNFPPIDVQWTQAGSDLFHVSLSASYVDVDFYTTADTMQLSAADWQAVVDSALGENLGVVVEGLTQAQPSKKYASTKLSVHLSHDSIDKSAIYYWASSKGSLMTQNFGSTGAPSVVKGDCTSCHSVSRSGSRIGYSRCVGGSCSPSSYIGFLRFDAASKQWLEAVDANAKAIPGNTATFSPVGYPFPDDKKSLAIVALRSGTLGMGPLELYDPDTGIKQPSNVSTVSTHGPNGPRYALMPDWSPDGKSVAYASTNSTQWDIVDGSIAVMSYDAANGQNLFGEPSFVVEGPITLGSGTYTNFFFPSWSNDGNLLVFNAARGRWRNMTVAADAGARLMLADRAGSWRVDLTAINGPGDLDVTWPHWAPGATNEYLWIVFSSERNYGHLLTPANTNSACVKQGHKQCKQLWIGAVDRSKLSSGSVTSDPSAPPAWLPGQDVAADNISPYWSAPAAPVPE